MNQLFAVVDHRFCIQHDVQLRLKERISWSGDDFDIYSVPTNQLWFKVKGKAFNWQDAKTLRDAHGTDIAQMRQPVFHGFHPRMQVQGPGYSFEVIKRVKFLGHEAKAVVLDKTTGQRHTLHMYGNWTERRMQVYLGKRKQGARLLASARRQISLGDVFANRQTYNLTVNAGVDCALCVLLCVAFDEFWNDG